MFRRFFNWLLGRKKKRAPEKDMRLGLGLSLTAGAGGVASLTAPTITLTSASGTNPPTFSATSPDMVVGDTMYLSYTSNGTEPDTTAEESQTFTSAHALGDPVVWSSFTGFAGGATVKWKYAYGRSGYATAWSNTLTDTMAAGDTTPDAFTFTDQSNVAVSTTITSAAITVSGINAPASITVTGGTYDINGSGSFTSSGGTVNNGDTVRARHTSSASNSTATNTVVTIGGVSDTFTSTTVAAASDAAWHTTTGTNKSQYLVKPATGDTLTVQCQAGFAAAPCFARATESASGKRQFEITFGNSPTSVAATHIGVNDGSQNFNTNWPIPGKDNSTGVNLRYIHGASGTWTISHGGADQQTNSHLPAVANGDVITCEFDTTAGTVSFYYTPSGGSTSQIGSTVTGISFTNWYAHCGGEDASTATGNFGASAFTRSLSSGYQAYG